MASTKCGKADELDDSRQTALGMARYAFQYIAAARLIDDHHGAKNGHELVSPIPAYFLALHGIELTLKAYLRHRGLKPSELRSKTYGHDVAACYRKAKELGLREVFKMKAADLRAMLLLIELNRFQALRYIRTGLNHYPSWATVEPLMVRMHQAVAKSIGAKTFTAEFAGYD